MAHALAEKAFARFRESGISHNGGGEPTGPSPLREITREAWDAMKEDNFEAFAEAFENALEVSK